MKGIDIFVSLSKLLDDRFQIVLVGVNEAIKADLPKNIISVPKTKNQLELSELYSAADVYVNPTREEVLGLTNIEALACGTPVITFNTGGSVECIDMKSGIVSTKDSLEDCVNNIYSIYENSRVSSTASVK